MRLSFNPEKTRQHDSKVRNPFLKWGANLLVSLSIASQLGAPKTALAETAPKTQIVAGKYHCDPPKIVSGRLPRGPGGLILLPGPSDLILTEKNGSLFATDYTGFTTQVKRIANGYTVKIKSGKVTVTGTGQFSADGTLRTSITRSLPHLKFTNICKRVEPPKPILLFQQPIAPIDNTTRAVFIRPCTGGAGLYSLFGNRASKGTTNVGCTTGICTVDSVSSDLIASGVTDVFIAFKTDGSPWSTGVTFDGVDGGSVWVPGRVGDLAYASQTFPNNIEPSIKAAQANGFDPINTLITSLQSAYSAANKTIRIHAWFPVFADWYAAQIAPQTGTYQAPNPTLPGVLPRTSAECHSDTGADPTSGKVVAYELDVLGEIATMYASSLYGINLDYIRYYSNKDQTVNCISSAGNIPLGLYSWNVNPQAIDNFVQQVKMQFPNLLVSADIFADKNNRQLVGQVDVPSLVGTTMLMAYTNGNSVNSDSNVVQSWITDFQSIYPAANLIPILRGYPFGNADLISDINAELKAIRSMGLSGNMPGYAIFNYVSVLTSTGNMQLSTLKNRIGF